MNNTPELSRAEYDILRTIWKNGELSVREVHDQLQQDTGWAYTTTKTVMDRMIAKDLLQRSSVHGVFVYQALISRPQGLARFIHFFAKKIFEIDRDSVLAMFSDNKEISTNELKELKKLLKDLDKEEP